MSIHIVTQIKKDVEQAKLRQYTINKQKKQLKYFSLYLKQIVKIQRYFRGYLVRKTRALQKQINSQLNIKQTLHFKNKSLTKQLDCLKQKRRKLNHSNLSKMIQHQKQNISENVRQIIKNVVHSADNYAKNAAISKISLGQLQRLKRQQKQMKAEVKQLELEKQCSEQRILGWQQKLNEIRAKIIQETSIKNKLQKQISSLDNNI